MIKYTCDKTSELPHQQRVIEEAKELTEKLNKLVLFFDNPIYKGLDEKEKNRLTRQSWAMDLYWGVLMERINNF